MKQSTCLETWKLIVSKENRTILLFCVHSKHSNWMLAYEIKINHPKCKHVMQTMGILVTCNRLVTKKKRSIIYDNDNHPLDQLAALTYLHIVFLWCLLKKKIVHLLCRYRNLIERALRARLVYDSPNMNRAVSFEYMNRQLVWNEFSVILTFLVEFNCLIQENSSSNNNLFILL